LTTNGSVSSTRGRDTGGVETEVAVDVEADDEGTVDDDESDLATAAFARAAARTCQKLTGGDVVVVIEKILLCLLFTRQMSLLLITLLECPL
jgi:hypothetical protein